MIDLDGFKRVNDDLGHLAGDALLVGLSGRMRGVVRGGEGIYRFGGDEFVALLPGADRASAAMIGERLCQAVSAQPFALGEGKSLAVTCSIGVASLPEDAGDPRALIATADEALLRAKASGKNRVEVAKPCLKASGS
jgi:diguanylate cyclase (GGDEF)-like protein